MENTVNEMPIEMLKSNIDVIIKRLQQTWYDHPTICDSIKDFAYRLNI